MNTETNECGRRITFDEMPGIMSNLVETLKDVNKRIGIIEEKLENPCKWINVDDLIKYLPTPPTKRTVYDWIRNKKIPYHKREKSVHFLTSEIDDWLKQNPSVVEDITLEKAEEYIKSHPKK